MSPSDPREKLITAEEAQSILDTCDLAARIVREGGTTAVLGEPTLADAVPDLAHTVKALHAEVARITAARDRAIAKVQQLARVITNEATTQDAVELLSAALLQDAASAPNCMEWRGDYGGRGFSVSVQWADGQSPHALIDEARRERDEARAILEGRTAPPTDAEIDAHHAAGGSWLTGDTVTWAPASLRGMRDNGETEGCVWIALDRSYRPCAWPRPGGGT